MAWVLRFCIIGSIRALAYLLSKQILMSLHKLAPRQLAGLVPLMFDLFLIIPHLFLPFLDLILALAGYCNLGFENIGAILRLSDHLFARSMKLLPRY